MLNVCLEKVFWSKGCKDSYRFSKALWIYLYNFVQEFFSKNNKLTETKCAPIYSLASFLEWKDVKFNMFWCLIQKFKFPPNFYFLSQFVLCLTCGEDGEPWLIVFKILLNNTYNRKFRIKMYIVVQRKISFLIEWFDWYIVLKII